MLDVNPSPTSSCFLLAHWLQREPLASFCMPTEFPFRKNVIMVADAILLHVFGAEKKWPLVKSANGFLKISPH